MRWKKYLVFFGDQYHGDSLVYITHMILCLFARVGVIIFILCRPGDRSADNHDIELMTEIKRIVIIQFLH